MAALVKRARESIPLQGIAVAFGCVPVLVTLAAPVFARTWVVQNNPEDSVDQIGAVVIAAASGDSILIGPGTYYEHIPVQDKSLTFIGRSGPEVTILDGIQTIEGREGAILYNTGDRTEDLFVQGLTFRNGTGVPNASGMWTSGGAVYWYSRSEIDVQIRDCIFEDNEAELLGGAVYFAPATLRIVGCRFSRNKAVHGGAASISTAGGSIEDCVFELSALDYGSDPAGIFIEGGGALRITGCEFIGTEGGDQQHCIMGGGKRVEIENNRFIDLAGTLATAIWIAPEGGLPEAEMFVQVRNNLFVRSGSTPQCDYACVNIGITFGETTLEGNTFFHAPDVSVSGGYSLQVVNNIFMNTDFSYSGQGAVACNDSWPEPLEQRSGRVEFRDNISADPLFCDPSVLDFHISDTSLCTEENAPGGCGRIGWLPPACHLTPVIERSWGQIKRQFAR